MARRHREHDRIKERFWRRTIRQQQASRLTVRAFCEAENLTEAAFYWWRRELAQREREKPPRKRGLGKPAPTQKRACSFVPVQVIPEPSAFPAPGPIEVIIPTGHIVRVPPGFDRPTLDGVLGILESR